MSDLRGGRPRADPRKQETAGPMRPWVNLADGDRVRYSAQGCWKCSKSPFTNNWKAREFECGDYLSMLEYIGSKCGENKPVRPPQAPPSGSVWAATHHSQTAHRAKDEIFRTSHAVIWRRVREDKAEGTTMLVFTDFLTSVPCAVRVTNVAHSSTVHRH